MLTLIRMNVVIIGIYMVAVDKFGWAILMLFLFFLLKKKKPKNQARANQTRGNQTKANSNSYRQTAATESYDYDDEEEEIRIRPNRYEETNHYDNHIHNHDYNQDKVSSLDEKGKPLDVRKRKKNMIERKKQKMTLIFTVGMMDPHGKLKKRMTF
ncbi:hypothetical protein BFRIG_01353 [Peribacillus frigoritolerans]|uniref:hypothetical protein n=1 Tax=Peribacillus frigoritolerans TaxID=450367 RepID=UPI0030D1A807